MPISNIHKPVISLLYSSALLSIGSLSSPSSIHADPYAGVILIQPDGESKELSQISGDYSSNLKAIAAGMGFEFSTLNTTDGLPLEITSTPAIIFQNERGRSIFQGRYADLGKVRHFLTTSRSIPQGDELLTYENAFVKELARTKIAANIKITNVEGEKLAEGEIEQFRDLAFQGIANALEDFEQQSTVSLQRTDRVFYFDFYPYRDENNQLFLGSALYSLFNCHVPAATYTSDPIAGSFDSVDQVFKETAKRLVNDLENVRLNSEIGDAFEPVGSKVAEVSWQSLGFELPENTSGQDYQNLDVDFPMMSFVLDHENTYEGAVQFLFPAPLDRYQGTAMPSIAKLNLDQEISGSITVPVETVTLGEDDLDSHVKRNLLRISSIKESTFTLNDFELLPDSFEFGKPVQTFANGTFKLKGIDQPLRVLVEFTPILVGDADKLEENSRLLVTASWEIRLQEPFGIVGPDGPAPQNDTVKFLANLTLKPETKQSLAGQ